MGTSIMNIELFWQLIEQSYSKDTDEMLSNLLQNLSELSSEETQKFRGYLNSYMEHVNDCIWVDMACKIINGYVSDDTGLYFALWLIAQGKNALYKALLNPDSLSEELTYIPFGNAEFEMLMSIGMDESTDYETINLIMKKCNEEIEPSLLYKGGNKYGDYDDFDEAMEDIPNILPNLIERAKTENFDWKGKYEL